MIRGAGTRSSGPRPRRRPSTTSTGCSPCDPSAPPGPLGWRPLSVRRVAFLGLQAYDYSTLVFGVHGGIYPSLFYVMTGLHMAHVIGGVVFLSIVLSQALTGQLSLRRHEPVEAAAIYWHFVDVVWIGLFLGFYVMTQVWS